MSTAVWLAVHSFLTLEACWEHVEQNRHIQQGWEQQCVKLEPESAMTLAPSTSLRPQMRPDNIGEKR